MVDAGHEGEDGEEGGGCEARAGVDRRHQRRGERHGEEQRDWKKVARDWEIEMEQQERKGQLGRSSLSNRSFLDSKHTHCL